MLATEPARALVELKALAARGSVVSMLYIADAYRKGRGTAVEIYEAKDWYTRAMQSGSVTGCYELGRIYYEQRNYSKAEEAFRQGESKNHAPSIHMLGLMHLKGIGVEKNRDKARELFEKASSLGHVFAKRNLAILLMTGRYGASQFVRGLTLFVTGIKHLLAVVVSDRYDERLR